MGLKRFRTRVDYPARRVDPLGVTERRFLVEEPTTAMAGGTPARYFLAAEAKSAGEHESNPSRNF